MTRAPGHIFKRRTVDQDQALAMLAQIDLAYRNGAWTAILGGAAICLAIVLVPAVLYFVATNIMAGGPSFTLVFAVLAVVLLPLMFVAAARFQRPMPGPATPASEQIRSRRDEDDDDASNDEVKALARRGAALGERVNTGARLVLWGVGRVRGRSAFATVPVERVALAVVTLVDAGQGVSPVKLLLPGESADELEPLLGVLLYHDLADLSKRADRVWITTEAKRKLGMPV